MAVRIFPIPPNEHSEGGLTARESPLQSPACLSHRTDLDSFTGRLKLTDGNDAKSTNLKRIKIATDKMVDTGAVWLSLSIVTWIVNKSVEIHTYLTKGNPYIILLAINMVGLVLNNAMSIYSIRQVSNTEETMLIPLLGVNIGLSIISLIGNIYQIYMEVHDFYISEEAKILNFLCIVFMIALGILACLLCSFYCIICFVAILIAVYISSLLYATAAVLIMIGFPSLMILLVLEIFFRFITCSKLLPSESQLCIWFEYEEKIFQGNSIDQNCIICLEGFKEGDIVTSLKCHDSHTFHSECIIQWVQKNAYCPICRHDLEYKEIAM